MVVPTKRRYEDLNPNKREDGCLFKCEDHGEWRERLKVLDEIPDIVKWMNREQGGRTTARLIIGTVMAVLLTGFISTALMFKSDVVANISAFKIEHSERFNLLKTELSERQAALKLEMSERQRIYEETAKDQNAQHTVRINNIVDAVAEIRTQTGIIARLNDQSQKQTQLEREEIKAMIRELQSALMKKK